MVTYLIQRWLLLVPTLALASIVIFAIITLAPGDPVRMMIGFEATAQEVTAERSPGECELQGLRSVTWATGAGG